MGGARRTQLGRAEALRLLGSVPVGRIVFTARALPAICPVTHVPHGGEVIIRSNLGPLVVPARGATAAGAIVRSWLAG